MIWQAVGICICTASICVLLRQYGHGEMAMMAAIACSLYVLALSALEAEQIINEVKEIASKTGLDTGILETVIKITGIAYITQTASGLCQDAGENALSGKVELCGKLMICALALPAVTALFDVISRIL